MSTSVELSRRQPRIADWLQLRLRWVTLPSWLLSAAFHVGLLFLLVYLTQLQTCRPDIQGDGGESFRQVGIVMRDEAAVTDPAEAASQDQQTTVDLAETETATQVEAIPAAPPVELPELPATSDSVLGVGGQPAVTSSMVEEYIQSTTGGSAGGQAASGEPQGASFLGASDVGSTFVYVIDNSYSMEESLRAAKAELSRSLQQLTESQQFQIIFYNTDQVLVLQPRNSRFDLFRGTDSQRLEAANQYQPVRAGAGTNHLPALKRALRFNPDVIFFLTDGQEPPLSRADLASIRRLNRGTRIHCIEFGEGPQTLGPGGADPGNWLRTLAAENSGRYVYRNVNGL